VRLRPSRTVPGVIVAILMLVVPGAGRVDAFHAAHPAPGDFLCPVGVRFSPHGGAEGAVVDTLRRARVRVHAAMYGLTNPAIETALTDLARAGVKVALKTDKSQSAGRDQAALLARLTAAGAAVEVSRSRFLLHDKFAVIDGRWVVTGSFNWTVSAERRNRENVLIFDCPALASNFEAEWESITTAHR
jgi:phosphatidylserine/phosphatidylglycerophosphate/cardiolipin synthase-like enzyme